MRYLKEQLITYLGNKRSLLSFLQDGIDIVKKDLKKDKLTFLDLFSGSGIVSRYMKFSNQAELIFANDLEYYSFIINRCYLTNINDEIISSINNKLDLFKAHYKKNFKDYKGAIITKNYAPKNDYDIKKDERVFFTNRNARFIDFALEFIENNTTKFVDDMYFLAPLLSEASIKTNTSGVFKGFYKDNGIGKFGGKASNCLSRIKSDINLSAPIFCFNEASFYVSNKEALECAKEAPNFDLAYLDPPYNAHPYSSNYHILNTIATNRLDCEISKVAGIRKDWNRSKLNKNSDALNHLKEIISHLSAKYILISYNNEGIIKEGEFLQMLLKFGDTKTITKSYNAFRGSRNLNKRELNTKEILFILKKN